MSEFEIRTAALADVPTLKNLSTELFKSDQRFEPGFNLSWPYEPAGHEYIQRSLGNSRLALIAEANGRPIGFLDAMILIDDSTSTMLRSEIGQMFVVARWRRRGVGRALFKEFLEWSRSSGVEELIVGVFEQNSTARGFYASVGFTPWIARLKAGIADITPPG